MISFKALQPEDKPACDAVFKRCIGRGSEHSFVNLFLWGDQRVAFCNDSLLVFSQVKGQSLYLYPVCSGDPVPALEAIMQDAKSRQIPCCLCGLSEQDCQQLEALYPGRFSFRSDRAAYDYIYDIEELAELKGRKFQKKRTQLNRFRSTHPGYTVEPMTAQNYGEICRLVDQWYADRLRADPQADLQMERVAFSRALAHYEALGLEGLALRHGGSLLAFTMGSILRGDTFDSNFEKALDRADGAYAAINYEFARYLRSKYPHLRWINREEDLGLEGLRRAKLSYNPHHMIEKTRAYLLEDRHACQI